MKKFIALISSLIVLGAAGAGTILHSKADMKIETAEFSVSADRSQRPSSYCRNSDGSPVSRDYSSSDNFCISQYAEGNETIMSYDGYPAYCIGSHLQNAPTSLMQATRYSDIPYDDPEYAAIFRIAAAGASSGRTDYNLNSTDLYYVTQCAVRGYLYGIAPESLAFFYDDGTLNDAMTNEFFRISYAAYEEYIPFSSELKTTSSDEAPVQIFTDEKCYFRYGPFQPYSEYTDISYYTLECGAEENVIISAFGDFIPAESETEFQSECPFYVYIDSTYTEEVNITINSEAHVTRYNPTVYLASDTAFQNIFQINITEADEQLSGELKLVNTDTTGDIRVNKKFIADNIEINDLSLISQPRFSVKNQDGNYVYGIQTDGKIIFDHFSSEPVEFALTSDSVINISGLPVGEYTVCEIKGADGFEAQNAEIAISNTIELNTCVIINESIITTTTTAPVTTTVEETTTVAETTTPSESTTPYDITFTLPETTVLLTNITEEVFSETTVETTEESKETSPLETLFSNRYTRPSNPKIPHSPKTGDSRYPVSALTAFFAVSGLVVLRTVKK